MCEQVIRVPLLRYFLSVGGLLLAVLFLAGWLWPADPIAPVQQASAESPFEQTIRIQSARRWPDKIQFDTTQPTIVPPPAPVVIASPAPTAAASSPLDARAEVKPVVQPAPPPKRQAKVRHRNPRPNSWEPPSTFASANQTAPSWPFRWQ
jgi:hypothetical protein